MLQRRPWVYAITSGEISRRLGTQATHLKKTMYVDKPNHGLKKKEQQQGKKTGKEWERTLAPWHL
jgi:hypothetical protein